MPYLVDSNIVIDNLLDVPSASALLEQLALEGIAISIVTYMEAFQGVEQSSDPRKIPCVSYWGPDSPLFICGG
jgi:predicted nucleic acid-binding protein